MTPALWRITLEYPTSEQAKTAVEIVSGTAPSLFRVEIMDDEGQTGWFEQGMIHLRRAIS